MKERPTPPNVHDPLSEPTIARRVWAGYLAAGYTRYRFAKLLEMSYQGLDKNDTGKTAPQLETLMKAAPLIGFTLDQLCYGHAVPKANEPRREQPLSVEAIKSIVHSSGASAGAAELLGEYEQSPSGKYHVMKRSWLLAFLGHCTERLAELPRMRQADPDVRQAIIDSAKALAAEAEASVDMNALRVEPQKRGQLAKAAKIVLVGAEDAAAATSRKRKALKNATTLKNATAAASRSRKRR